MKIFGLFVLLFSLSSLAKPKVLWSERLKSNHVLEIQSVPSRPNGNGSGFCGAGEEWTLFVKSEKKVLYKKLIQSCLKNYELDDDGAQKSDTERVWQAVNVDDHGMSIRWIDDKLNRITTRVEIAADKIRVKSVIPKIN